MKINLQFTIRLWQLLIFCFLVLCGCNNNSNNNIILNPGFENKFESWDPYQYGSGWNPETSNPHSGLFCAEFSFPNGSKNYDASIRQKGINLEVIPNTPYIFSFWRRGVDAYDKNNSNETILDASLTLNGVNYSHPMPIMVRSLTWIKVSKEITFLEAGIVSIDFQLHGNATTNKAVFAIDDISLIKK
jgi:hypothetical protein